MPAMRHRCICRLVTTLLVAWAALAGSGCSREQQTPLRVGTHVWPGFEPLYLAREQGYYPAGRIRMVEYATGSEGLRAFRGGAIDAVALTLDEALLLAETTRDVAIVLVMDTSDGGDAILVRPTLADLRALRGRRVGLETTALGAYMLTRGLQTVGMTPRDVRVVPLETPEQERAFKEGRVDAVVTYDPFRTRLLAFGARQVFDSRRIPGEIVDVLVVRRSYASGHREQVADLVRAWFEALEFVRKDRRRAAALMARREHLQPDAFERALSGLRFFTRAQNRAMLSGPAPGLAATTRRLGDVMVANRLLERPPRLSGLLDDRFVREDAP